MTIELELTRPEQAIEDEAREQLKTAIVDNGIGAYEFWGARFCDRSYCLELADDSPEEITVEGSWPPDEWPTKYNVILSDEGYELSLILILKSTTVNSATYGVEYAS